jgi:tetratricopeptide (TPR) repeat protein
MKRNLILVLILLPLLGFSQLNYNNVIHTGRSRLYFGNYTGAIQSFNLVINMNPHLPEPYYYRGVAKLNLEDFRGAKRDLDKALEIKPFYAEAVMYRGVVNYNLKEYDQAMKDYSEALELDGENADIYNNRGICKAAMRDFEGAIADYTKSIELKNKNFNAYLNRSIAYQMLEKWDKAIADCNQLIRIRPNSSMGYLSRGLIKIEKNDFASALRDFDMAVYLEPQNSFAYQNRAMVKQQLGSWESAIMDYDMALSIDPQLASAYFNRGIAKEMLGHDGYQADYNNASLLDPRFAKRPWQTPEERDQAQAQQLQAWKQQMQQQNQRSGNTTIQTASSEQTDVEEKVEEIDLDELKKRKAKANLATEETQNSATEIDDEGRVQYKNISIQLMPMFDVGIINKKDSYSEEIGYFNMTIENLNAKNNYDPYLTLTNRSDKNGTSVAYFKNQLLIFDERIKQNGSISDNYLYRGIFKALLNEKQQAVDDFTKAINLNEKNLLAYFMRANTASKIVNEVEKLKQQFTVNNLASPKQPDNARLSRDLVEINAAYSDIFTDYSVVLYMNPEFYFGYYNRGNIYCQNEKYLSALDEYNKAITIEPDFAEAYYNRGLVRILLNDIEGGAKDLSRAGELGIAESYNVIKRYCN